MTVRIQKPAFNIRGKLSELERPIGLKGSELMRSETTQDARDLVSAGRKNLIINGGMAVAQRGTSFTTAFSGTFAADRWEYEASTNAVVTVSQQTAWNNGPYWAHSIKVETTTARSSTAASNFGQFLYHIEANDFGRFRFGTVEAKPFTFSFWVKSNKTGKFPASFQNHGGSRVFPTDYTINEANIWEKKIIVVPGDTNGSWNLHGNGTGLRFTLMWAMGSNFTGGTKGAWATTTSFANLTTTAGDQMDVVGATLEFAQIQLEAGKNATEFEHRSYGEELALCQRYFQRIGKQGYAGVGKNDFLASGFVDSNGTAFYGGANLKVSMRSSPTISINGTASHLGYTHPSVAFVATGLNNYWSNPESYVINLDGTGSGTTGFGAYARISNNETQLDFNAEL